MPKLLPLPSSSLPLSRREPTDLQKRLVDIFVAAEHEEGISVTQAAINAGYRGGREAARVSATKALQQPHVQKYLQERLQTILGIGAVGATATLVRLSTGAKSEYVRLHAAASVLDRAGITKPDQSVRVNAGELIVNIDLS